MPTNCQQNWLPATHVTIDEAMLPFCGRSEDAIKVKNKPIEEGFKVRVLPTVHPSQLAGRTMSRMVNNLQKITAPNAHHLILCLSMLITNTGLSHQHQTVHQKYAIPSTLCPTMHLFSFMSNYTAVLSAFLNTSILFFSLPRRSSKSHHLTIIAFGSAAATTISSSVHPATTAGEKMSSGPLIRWRRITCFSMLSMNVFRATGVRCYKLLVLEQKSDLPCSTTAGPQAHRDRSAHPSGTSFWSTPCIG
jgi:hypothetical protein